MEYKKEFGRQVFNKKFVVITIFFIALNTLQFILNFSRGNLNSDSIYGVWIGADTASLVSDIFYFSIPILCPIILGGSYFYDIKNRIVFDREYFKVKWLSVFLSGGLATTIPMNLNLILYHIFFKASLPRLESQFYPINDSNPLIRIFIEFPFVYGELFIISVFIFSGFVSTLSLIITRHVDKLIIAYMFPFVLFTLLSKILRNIDMESLDPLNTIRPWFNESNNFIFFYIIILSLITSYLFFIKNIKKAHN